MKHLSAAVAAFLCASVLVVAVPGTSFAGGGHGYKRHHGHNHHHRGHRGHGYRHHRRSSYSFNFFYYSPRPYYTPGYGYTRHYRPPQVVYVQPPVQWVEPSPQYVTPPAVQQQWTPAPAKLPEGCRMVREFQTQVMIGGELADAYGDVCLKPDGSWERGPAKIVPQ